MPELEKLHISRCYLDDWPSWNGVRVQLHVITDANQDAFAAVTYLRLEPNGEIRCMLLGSKTRTAPIKLQSIPRLELDGARLGVQFTKLILDPVSLPTTIEKVTYWTDSATILTWSRGDSRANASYVAFHVVDIQNLQTLQDGGR